MHGALSMEFSINLYKYVNSVCGLFNSLLAESPTILGSFSTVPQVNICREGSHKVAGKTHAV